jgi:hypothetical protein
MGGFSSRLRLFRGLYQGIDYGITHAGILQADDLVGRQMIPGAGILDIGDDYGIADMGIRHVFNFGQSRSWRECGSCGL